MSELLSWLNEVGPDWFSAVGTVGALGVALVLLAFQAKDRRRDARERRKAQAGLIAVALERTGYRAVNLFNASGSPVYSLVLGAVHVQGAGVRTLEDLLEGSRESGGAPITTLSVLPPGRFRATLQAALPGAMGARPAAEVAFTDGSGRHWIRRAGGQLDELSEEPLSYFAKHGLYGPYEMQVPEPID